MGETTFHELRPELVWASVRGRTYQGAVLWRKVFPGTDDQVPRARHLVRALLMDTAFAEDAEYVTSELMTNALRHAPRSGSSTGSVIVECLLAPCQVRVAVYDLGGGGTPRFATPRFATPMPLSGHGYGLRAVMLIASQAGQSGSPDTGHVVWAILTHQ
ncbi:ATP-binding protein [Acrocarpospora sp. B8E8]|uniref:ATP-binding protein n=1 Tax=Acrocarpospora sp. B8E8 TaxID=3153572 RepID=UPI00325F8DEC